MSSEKGGKIVSAPIIPTRNRNEAINDLLESIALEETAIAHLINAEGEKIQKLVQCNFPAPDCFEQVLEFQQGISNLFDKLIKKQDQLVAKMKLVVSFYDDRNSHGKHKKAVCRDDEM